jgi:hypothetical protein
MSATVKKKRTPKRRKPMCNPASFVVTKENVYWSMRNDAHEEIIKEFKLKEMDGSDTPLFVRVEISPQNGDMSIDLDKWIYKLDQDIKPRWYKEEKVETRTRTALKEWADARLFVSRDAGIIKYGFVYLLGSSRAVLWGSSRAELRGSSRAELRESSRAELRESSRAVLKDKSVYQKDRELHAVKGAWKLVEEESHE